MPSTSPPIFLNIRIFSLVLMVALVASATSPIGTAELIQVPAPLVHQIPGMFEPELKLQCTLGSPRACAALLRLFEDSCPECMAPIRIDSMSDAPTYPLAKAVRAERFTPINSVHLWMNRGIKLAWRRLHAAGLVDKLYPVDLNIFHDAAFGRLFDFVRRAQNVRISVKYQQDQRDCPIFRILNIPGESVHLNTDAGDGWISTTVGRWFWRALFLDTDASFIRLFFFVGAHAVAMETREKFTPFLYQLQAEYERRGIAEVGSEQVDSTSASDAKDSQQRSRVRSGKFLAAIKGLIRGDADMPSWIIINLSNSGSHLSPETLLVLLSDPVADSEGIQFSLLNLLLKSLPTRTGCRDLHECVTSLEVYLKSAGIENSIQGTLVEKALFLGLIFNKYKFSESIDDKIEYLVREEATISRKVQPEAVPLIRAIKDPRSHPMDHTLLACSRFWESLGSCVNQTDLVESIQKVANIKTAAEEIAEFGDELMATNPDLVFSDRANIPKIMRPVKFFLKTYRSKTGAREEYKQTFLASVSQSAQEILKEIGNPKTESEIRERADAYLHGLLFNIQWQYCQQPYSASFGQKCAACTRVIKREACKLPASSPCGHHFHADCIRNAIAGVNCPDCDKILPRFRE